MTTAELYPRATPAQCADLDRLAAAAAAAREACTTGTGTLAAALAALGRFNVACEAVA